MKALRASPSLSLLVSLLALAACSAPGHGAGGEADASSSDRIALWQAIQIARPEAAGGAVVGAGMEDEDEYEITVIAGDQVRTVEVDAHSGKVMGVKTRPVHEGREAYAASLRELVPGAKTDLMDAIEIAEKKAGGSARGIEAGVEDGKLLYEVAVVGHGGVSDVSIDAASGNVLAMEKSEARGEREEARGEESEEMEERGEVREREGARGEESEEKEERGEMREREGARGEEGEEMEEPEKAGERSHRNVIDRVSMKIGAAIDLAQKEVKDATAVGAGLESDEEGSEYRITLLGRELVKEVEIDAVTGKLGKTTERPVHKGREELAAKLRELLPSAKIGLAQAVEIATKKAGGGFAMQAGASAEEGKLRYEITVLAGKKLMGVAVDPVSGEVLQVEEAGAGEDGEEAEEHGEMREREEKDEDDDEKAPGVIVVEVGKDGQEKAATIIGLKTDTSVQVLSFDKAKVGELPAGWKIEGTAQKGPLATWTVATDDSAPSKPNVLALTKTNHDSGSTFNLCWTDKIRFQDGSIDVSFKPVTGEGDQGGGLIWRAKDKDNYYLCRANPLESNFRVYVVKDGNRKQLGSAKAEIAAGKWHTLHVGHEGGHIVCSLDGQKLLNVTDSTFPDAGGVGLWTKADAVTSFDDLRIQNLATETKAGGDEKK